MTDIKKAADELKNKVRGLKYGKPKIFFKRIKNAVDLYEREMIKRSDHELLSEVANTAKSCIKSIKTEGKFDNFKDTPFVYILCESYIQAEDDRFGSSFYDFVAEITSWHDFKISETLLLREFLSLALIDSAASGLDDTYTDITGMFASLDNVDFDKIYLDFTKTHLIFGREAAGVYSKCSRDTIYNYDEMLILKYGADEISNAGKIVQTADEKGEHIGKFLTMENGNEGKAYFWLLFVLSFCLFSLEAVISDFLVALISLPVIYALAKEIAVMFYERKNHFLPRIVSGPELDKTKCVVSITTLLCGEKNDKQIFDGLEDYFLTNRQDNFVFAVLGDLKESERKRTPEDINVKKYAQSRIRALNEKYGDHFALFIRKRRFALCEKKYLGWERKRGAVLELCRFAKGDDGSFDTVIGGEKVREAKYLLTLDSDTRPGISSVRKLLGIMLHPQNRAVVDMKKGVVTNGFGIVQPKTVTSLSSASTTAFASFSGGEGGVDRYSSSSFDLYFDVYGKGIFCGKGMIDIDAYLSVCDGFFPKERILSHDLLEGALCGTACAKDVIFTDGTPKTAPSYFQRLDRWLRGDLQALSYVTKRVKNENGQFIDNPMNALSRYQILDNLIRASIPLFTVFLIAVCSSRGYYFSFFPLLYIALPVFRTVFETIISFEKQSFYSVKKRIGRTLSDFAFRVVSLGMFAGTFVKSAVNVIYSAVFSKRGFLSWTTAAEAEQKEKNGLLFHYRILFPSVLIGAFCLAFSIPSNIFGVIFILFPLLMSVLGRKETKWRKVSEKTRRKLIGYASDIWKFFSENVNRKTNWLPPDNVQLSPVNVTAMRTSPTNIGLYFSALLSARDFGFIDTTELYFRSSEALKSLEKMATWNGHLYNWYDIETLSVIGVPFISSVDSGNFVTCLVSFCEGITEYASENVELIDVKNRLSSFIFHADFSVLIHKTRGFLSVGYDVSTSTLSDSCYDTLMSEARTTAFFMEAMRVVPDGYYYKLGRRIVTRRGKIGCASWSGTAFEFFMPSLFLPDPENSLSDRSLGYAFSEQIGRSAMIPGKNYSVFGVSESGYFGFDKDMNYQYRAFGIQELSVDPFVRDESVVCPYSSFLMMHRGIQRTLLNLDRLKSIGMYGKYGFFEALDMERSRVGNGYAVIKSYMSHHLGMSLAAISNLCFDNIISRRFMREPNMRAGNEILGERTPSSAKKTNIRRFVKREEKPILHYSEKSVRREKRKPSLLSPEVYMLSNNKTRVVTASSGQIAIYDAFDLVTASPFDKYDLGGGLQFYSFVDGEYLSAVPLGYTSDGFKSTFDFECGDEKITYYSSHEKNGRKIRFSVSLALCEDDETVDISCRVAGDVDNARFMMYFEPVMAPEREYLSHKSFSNLFITSRFYSDEMSLVFERRPRSDGRVKKYLGVCSFPPIDKTGFDTRRDGILPLMYSTSDIAHLVNTEGGGKTGADIIPACVIRTENSGGRIHKANFKICYMQNCDDLLYRLSHKEKNEYSGRVRRLQTDFSGADENVRKLEQDLLAFAFFSSGSKKAASAGILASLAKNPVKQSDLWRHGVSWDNITVSALCDELTDREEKNLSELLSMFKYTCIRGFRFDFVVLYSETDRYAEPKRKKIEELVAKAGLSSFIGANCGIFVIDLSNCSEKEISIFMEFSCVSFELRMPNRFFSYGRRDVKISEMTENELKRKPNVKFHESSLPAMYHDTEIQGKFALLKKGILIRKNRKSPPWAHIISTEIFGTVLSENSLGFTFYKNAYLGKLTPHSADNMLEDAGEKIIIRAYSGDSFEDYDAVACSSYAVFSNGKAEYFGSAGEINYSVIVEICAAFPAKKVVVKIDKQKNNMVKIIYLVDPCVGTGLDGNDVVITECKEKNAVSFSSAVEKNRNSVGGLLAVNSSNSGRFFDRVEYMTDGYVFGGDLIAAVYDTVFADENHISEFFLCAREDGVSDSEIAAKVKNFDEKSFSLQDVSPTVETGNDSLDEFVNFWLPYQTIVSRMNARAGFYQVGGAYGFRDQLQDALSIISFMPRAAREHIIRAASHQYTDGSVMHWWHEYGNPHSGIRSRCSDDSAWLSYVLCEYIEKTGDKSVAFELTPYLWSKPLSDREQERYEVAPFTDRTDTVLNHAIIGLKRTFRRGVHGLPLFGSGDWNDGMNNVGKKGKGESVWLAFFSAVCAVKLANICEMLGDSDTASALRDESISLVNAAKRTFDGSWFARGYYDNGEIFGSVDCDECKIDVMPQAFAAIAASEADDSLREKAVIALRNAYSILCDKKHSVFRLLYPPFDDGDQSPGYIKGYVPGIRENGGQYTHAAVFAALGMLRVGMNREAAELLFMIDPMMNKQPFYEIEPYVLAGDVYSNPDRAGRGGWSWYTGAAGWYRTVFIEELCGLKQKDNSFSVFPHFSDLFSEFTLKIKKDGSVYTVHASLSDNDFAVLDGHESKNEFVFDGTDHTVEIFSSGTKIYPNKSETLDFSVNS